MEFISEAMAEQLLSVKDAIAAIEDVFISHGKEQALAFPVVREKLSNVDAVFGVKSGHILDTGTVGLKAGGYWACNEGKGLTNHQSFTVLFDQETGVAKAFVSANYATGMRTAAASAVATRRLARTDAKVLAMVGAGGQALYQIEAMLAVRSFETIRITSRNFSRAKAVADRVVERFGIEALAVETVEEALSESDVVTTATPSTQPLVRSGWIRSGTHINCIGADTAGKQELEPAILGGCGLFVDDWQQAISIGECQTAFQKGLIDHSDVRGTLGELLNERCPGRLDDHEITVFDSTGLSIQDIAIANRIIALSK